MEFIEGHYYTAIKTQKEILETKTLSRKGCIRKCIKVQGRTNIVAFSVTENDIIYYCQKDRTYDYEIAKKDLMRPWWYADNIWKDVTHEIISALTE